MFLEALLKPYYSTVVSAGP